MIHISKGKTDSCVQFITCSQSEGSDNLLLFLPLYRGLDPGVKASFCKTKLNNIIAIKGKTNSVFEFMFKFPSRQGRRMISRLWNEDEVPLFIHSHAKVCQVSENWSGIALNGFNGSKTMKNPLSD